MYCSKCGKEVEKDSKFCASCGTKVEAKETKKEEVKKETVKAEKVETKVEEKPRGNGLGIAGMVLGIISLILSWTIIPVVLAILGLILSLCSRGKKGFKITGIITNALAIVLCFIFLFFYISVGSFFGGLAGEIGSTVKSGYPYGTWTCVPYSSLNLYKYDYDNIASNSEDNLTVLTLNKDNTYKYGPKKDSYKNYYKGTFSYEIETEKNETYREQGYSFLTIDGPANEYMLDGVRQDTTNKNIKLEMELFKQYDYDKALIIFTSTYNMYMCER